MMEGSDSDDASPDMGANLKRAMQYWLDKSTIHIFPRWVAFAVSLALVFLRIYLVQGYFIGAYGLSLPTSAKEGKEYRPFARRLPEFKFWMACTRGVGTSLLMTFFSIFDVPVFWPILLMYF